MDITEAVLRNEDLSKTDFFDFVTCPGETSAQQPLEAELKETNNNHLASAEGLDQLLWGESSSVKLETAIFEDWNKLWGHAPKTSSSASNTDGAIYTLTVLNGEHQPSSWFSNKPELAAAPAAPDQPASMDLDTLMLPSFTFTSSDPLLTENNNSSLLRSALQGKAPPTPTFRYTVKVEDEDSEETFATTGVLPSMFETTAHVMQHDSEDPSAHSMDELLLSQLDVTYDYEKLRRIEDEVAESAQQFCATPPPPQKNNNKKYSKRAKTEKTTSAPATASSSSSAAARKERSLHYCTICSKGFKDKYSVNVHIRTHTGEKPFACNLCGKSFRQKAHLAKHYQTHAQKSSLSPNHKATKR